MKRNIFYCIFIITITVFSIMIVNNKSYSYGITKSISGSSGNKVINYIDSETDSLISWNDANKYFGVSIYEEVYDEGKTIYFYKGKETSYSEYIKGSSIEEADNKAALYGKNAYRVRTTSEFKHALDDIYNNLRFGEFHIIFSKYESIDINEVYAYFNTLYGVSYVRQNYYPYAQKGMWEPNRFSLDINSIFNSGEMILDTTSRIRISGNEREVVESFVNNLLPYLYKSGGDYEKILAAYTYITQTTSYLSDDGFINNLLSSNTSLYDALISRKTTCIGYSIAFSYIMDKMGIESYIVDNITEANEATGTFSSVHTYNIVKLNGKFYKADLTGNIFLGAINPSELYDSRLNISTTAYNGNKNISINYDEINALLNNSKNIKTTTTARVVASTTTKTFPYTLPNGYVTTKKQENINTNTTQGFVKKTTIITTMDASGNIIEVPTEVDEYEEIITTEANDEETTSSIEHTKTINTKNDNNKNKKGFNYNYILFPLLIIMILSLIVLRIKNGKKVKIELNTLPESKEIATQDYNKEDE
ncbi:MAG: hypothetical protein J1F35_01170 [Erysipelotrichales bacterium]|nr:hypothetical protein [Erysipelotrichales bacterium]